MTATLTSPAVSSPDPRRASGALSQLTAPVLTPGSHPGLFCDPLAERMVSYLRQSTAPSTFAARIIRRAAGECWGYDERHWPVGVRSELQWAEA